MKKRNLKLTILFHMLSDPFPRKNSIRAAQALQRFNAPPQGCAHVRLLW